MDKGIFYAVGVGIGDPLDMTLKAKQILESADVILIPVGSEGAVSAAYRIAEKAADMTSAEHIEAVFPMKAADDYREYMKPETMELIKSRLDEGKNIAMVTLGDVSMYSTATYVRQIVADNGYMTQVIAGLPTFSVSAARACISLCENKESLCVLPGVTDEKELMDIIEKFENIVIMKAGKASEWLMPFLERKGLSGRTIVFSNVGMEDEFIGKTEDYLKLDRKGYFTTLIIKKGGIK